MHAFYKLLIAVIILSPVHLVAQKRFSAAPVKLTPHPILAKVFRKYNLVSLDTKGFNQYIKANKEREIKVQLDLGGKSFSMLLHANDILAKDYKLIVATDKGRQTYSKPGLMTYAGSLANDNGSSVYLTITDGMIHGMINGSAHQYFIEPLRYIDRTDKTNTHVLYEPKNVILHAGVACGVTDVAEKISQLKTNATTTLEAPLLRKVSPARVVENAGQTGTNTVTTLDAPAFQNGTATGTCKMIRLALASDDSMYYRYGTVDILQERNISVANVMISLYGNAQIGSGYLQFTIAGQFIATTPEVNPLTPKYAGAGMNTLLANFTKWGQDGNFGFTYDLGELWTAKDILYQNALGDPDPTSTSVVGIANQGSICQPNPYNVLEDVSTYDVASLGAIQAHETGHTLNAMHDPDGSYFIMAPSLPIPLPTQFSPASLSAMNDYLNNKGVCLSSCSAFPVTPQFNISTSTICTGGNVTVSDYTEGSLLSRTWSFPGASITSSTAQSQTVSYSTNGPKTITLTIVTAQGNQSVSKQVIVANAAKAACKTSVAGTTDQPVIASFSLGTMHHKDGTLTIGGVYRDFTCIGAPQLLAGKTYGASTSMGFNQSHPARFQVFIDFNNDGDFLDDGELVYTSPGCVLNSYNFPIVIPDNLPVLDSLVRLRIVALGCTQTTNGCAIPANAQVEDYSVYFTSSSSVATITPDGPTTFCDGGSVTLTASAGSSYHWSSGQTSSSIVVTASGSYSVDVTDANGQTATSAATSVTVNPLPHTTISAGGPTTFCAGGSVTLTASGGTSYNWRSGNNTTGILVTSTGDYSVTATDQNGCSTASDPVHVTVNPLPTPSVTITGPASFCSGNTSTMLTSSAAESYLWSDNQTAQSIHPITTGQYSVTVKDANGCSATSGSTVIQVNTPPVATITAGGPTTFCAGGNVMLTASPGANYKWSNSATTQSIIVSAGGNYSVTVTNSTGCSATSDPIVISVNDLPSVSITPTGATTFCVGQSVTLNSSPGNNYKWSTNASTASINVKSTGDYSVTVTNSNGCSATSDPISVVVNALPSATITADGPTGFCQGQTVGLTSSAGVAYLWSNSQTTQTIIASSPGDYTVTLTDNNGCTAISSITNVSVTQTAQATITANGPVAFCRGGSVMLSASAGSSYLWSNGQTSSSINVTDPGNYSVTVTNSGGCSSTSASTQVKVNELPSATISANGPTTFCSGGTVTLSASPGAVYFWSTQDTGPAINVSTTQQVSVTVTDNNGCSATSVPINVLVNVLPTPAITAGSSTTFCAGGNVQLTASPATTYLWSNNATTPSITVADAASYSVTVTDNNGCTGTSAATTVIVNSLPSAVIAAPASVTTGTTGNTASVLNAGTGATYAWTIRNGSITAGNNTNEITFTAGTFNADTLAVSVTNSSGCSASSGNQVVAISIGVCPPVSVASQTSVCSGSSGNLASVANGGKGATYSWNITNGTIVSGSATNTITFTAGISGTVGITVSVTNSKNCKSTSPVRTIKINPLPVASITAASSVCSKSILNFASVTSAGPGAYYAWSITNGTIIAGRSGPVISYIAGTSGAITLSVRVTNSSGCSVTSANKTITINSLPNAAITATSPVCSGSSGNPASIANAGSGADYYWTIFDGTITSGNKTNNITYKAGAIGAVTIAAVVTNGNGCVQISAPKQILITAPKIPTFTSIGVLCQNAKAPSLPGQSTNGVAGKWSPATISTASIGTTTYTFTPSAGLCAIPLTIKITVQKCATKLIVSNVDSVQTDNNNSSVSHLETVLVPNPTQNSFALITKSSSVQSIEIHVYDMAGRSVDKITGSAGRTVYFGSRYVQGMYIVEVLQGSERRLLKAVKN